MAGCGLFQACTFEKAQKDFFFIKWEVLLHKGGNWMNPLSLNTNQTTANRTTWLPVGVKKDPSWGHRPAFSCDAAVKGKNLFHWEDSSQLSFVPRCVWKRVWLKLLLRFYTQKSQWCCSIIRLWRIRTQRLIFWSLPSKNAPLTCPSDRFGAIGFCLWSSWYQQNSFLK